MPVCASATGNQMLVTSRRLILYDAGRRRIRIKTDLAGKTAGAFFLELAIRAPYILLGGQPWLCMEEEADYPQAGEMVRVMRQECW